MTAGMKADVLVGVMVDMMVGLWVAKLGYVMAYKRVALMVGILVVGKDNYLVAERD